MKRKQEIFEPDNQTLGLQILTETNPKIIKGYGRQVKNYSEKVWNVYKYDIMKTGVLAKFTQNPELKAALLATGDKIMVEASPYDCIWGIGLDAKNAKLTHPSKWPGQNLLGKVLMEVRTILSV